MAQSAGKGVEHQTEQTFSIARLHTGIIAFAHHSAAREQIWWKQRPPIANHGQQVGFWLIAGKRHHHERSVAWSLLIYAEQPGAVEEVSALHERYVRTACVCHYPVAVHDVCVAKSARCSKNDVSEEKKRVSVTLQTGVRFLQK